MEWSEFCNLKLNDLVHFVTELHSLVASLTRTPKVRSLRNSQKSNFEDEETCVFLNA